MANAWTVVGSVSAVVAAAAALVAVWFARRTVLEARAGRREAHDAHAEEIREQTRLLEATTLAHEQEMAAREHASASEIVFQRLVQTGRHRTTRADGRY